MDFPCFIDFMFRTLPSILVLSGLAALGGLWGCAPNNGTNSSCTILSFSTETKDMGVGVGITGLGGASVAQSFMLSANSQTSLVTLKLEKVGTLPLPENSTVTLTIEQNAASLTNPVGAPSGTPVSAEATAFLPTSKITTAGNYEFRFSNRVPLVASTMYWLHLKASYAVSNSGSYAPVSDNYIRWLAHDGADGYANGFAIYETGTPNLWLYNAIGPLRDLIFYLSC